MKRAKKARKPAALRPTDEDLARADKPSDPPIACATMAPSNPGRDLVAMIAPAAVERLGAALVDAAIDRLRGLHDPDRGVALVNAYIALVAIDGRARV